MQLDKVNKVDSWREDKLKQQTIIYKCGEFLHTS